MLLAAARIEILMSYSFASSRTLWLAAIVMPLLFASCQSASTKPNSTDTSPRSGQATYAGNSPVGTPSDQLGALSALEYPANSEWIYKLATVEDVQATISSSNPSEASVTVRGLLPDGATRINNVKVQRLPEGIFLTITTARPRKAMATMALVPFERTVQVDLKGLPKGESRITANDAPTTVIVP